MSKMEGLPVAGYRPQPEENVTLVNQNKIAEENILRLFDRLAEAHDIDRRWLSIGRTHIEQGFMAMNRAIFRPARLALPEDEG